MADTDAEHQLRLSNAISAARILCMLWIFSDNYFPFVFSGFYDSPYGLAISRSGNFLDAVAPVSYPDRLYTFFSYSGWSGVVGFIFLSGFSLWFSLRKSGVFEIRDYFVKRITSVYIPYLAAATVSLLFSVLYRKMPPQMYDAVALVFGMARLVPSAYNCNPPLWFITIIGFLYLFFPLVPMVYSRFRTRGLVVFTLLVSAFTLATIPLYNQLGHLHRFIPVFCCGILLAELLHSRANFTIGGLPGVKTASWFIAPVALCLLAKYIYFDFAANTQAAWGAGSHQYLAGFSGVAAFLAIGYLLPLKPHALLRWLSRGTMGVYMYHYVVLYAIVRYISAEYLTSHLIIALPGIYALLLAWFSIYQYYFDKTVTSAARKALNATYRLDFSGKTAGGPAQ